jgi:hypothetical protein
MLAAAGACYADSTGNLRLALQRPAIFLEQEGAEQDPARETRALASLKGPAAGRVVRALLDFRPPYGIRELAARSGTPIASVSRVVALLEREAILARGPRGDVREVDAPALLRRWVRDYRFSSSNRTARFHEAKGVDCFLRRLRRSGLRYAVTGFAAAARKLPDGGPAPAAAYVEDLDATVDRLDLRAVRSPANVVLASPFDPVVFDRAWSEGGVVHAALAQVAADLLGGPPAEVGEGQQLLAWMETHERAWRS